MSSSNSTFNLSLPLLYPTSDAISKTLLVYVNQELVYSFTPAVSNKFNHTVQFYIYPQIGRNNLSFTSRGMNDTQGFRLISVELFRQINPEIKKAMQVVTSNFVTQSFILMPGSRVLVGQLINNFVSFERMQFYYYHSRNFSDYYKLFLESISNLMDVKGNIALGVQQKVMGYSEENFITNQDYKSDYIYVQGLSKNASGYSLISNNSSLFAYSIPLIGCIFILFYVLFRLTFRWRISKLFRKFSFFGILVLMVCEGNIQQFPFYVFGEFTIFFSATFGHKIVNLFILSFFYLVFLASISIFIMFRIIYKKHRGYFMENTKVCWLGIVGYSIDQGLVGFLFGSVHQLMLLVPDKQLAVLGAIQIFWIAAQFIRVVKSVYEYQVLVWLRILEGFLRIALQISLYLYSQYSGSGKLKYLIGDELHLTIIFLFMSIWIMQFSLNIIILLKEIAAYFLHYFVKEKSNKLIRIANKQNIPIPQKNKLIPFNSKIFGRL